MNTKTYIIENPYEARLTIEPAVTEYKDGRARRRERRKKSRKN
jgi:hypothetical protein